MVALAPSASVTVIVTLVVLVAVAICEMVAVVELVTAVIVVLAGMPVPVIDAPTSTAVKVGLVVVMLAEVVVK